MNATTPLDTKCINTIRTLSMDAVQAANSGHPGTPMALALITTGDRHAIATRGPFVAEGDWVWRWKDRIDRRFMAKYEVSGPLPGPASSSP